MTDLIKINAKTPTATYDVEIAPGATVSELKDQLLTKVANATKSQLCVIYTGKILKDEETLDQLKIGDGYTVHLVVRSAAAPRPAPAAAAPTQPTPQQPTPNIFGAGAMPSAQSMMNNPEMMRQVMDNPMVQSMLSNPEFMRTMLTSNPQFQQMLERNPEVGHILNDPSIMRQTMEMIRNPNMFQEMMRNHDLAMRNLQGIPGGEAALERLYNDVQAPLLNSTTGGNNPFASLRNEAGRDRSDRAGQENSEALPNPWGPPAGAGAGAATGTASNESVGNNQQPTPVPGLGGMLNSPGMSSLMQQMMSNPEMTRSLFSPEMMRTMRETMRSNPSLMDSIIGASPAGQANPQLSNLMRQRLPEMLEMMENPEMIQAMQNPRVAEAFRQIQEGVSILRTEAPQLLGMMG
ncbi:unnamed protein product [Caenorhabditis angaria]|uniref:Ubiquitin-like domain-containing protein n=1 Tax=Caenorhabditis angaria TaxID=860376 RepID=A0A9P1MV13_9PELO|nr:unnamed protein product [Caenorhabditis angaria]